MGSADPTRNVWRRGDTLVGLAVVLLVAAADQLRSRPARVTAVLAAGATFDVVAKPDPVERGSAARPHHRATGEDGT